MRNRASLVGILIAGAALARVLPHPPNFVPIDAMALFSAAYIGRRWLAFLAPLLAMFLGDALLEITTRMHWQSGWLAGGSGFHRGMWVVYPTVALITALGMTLRNRVSVWSVAATTFASAEIFFVVTNLAVWGLGTMYPKTWVGLVECFTLALPFFQNTLAADVFYSTVLFGGFALAERYVPSLRPAEGFGEAIPEVAK